MKHDTQASARTSMPAVLKKLLCASAVSALCALAPAQAAVLTFDAVQNIVTPQLNAGDTAYNTGDAFMEAGFTLRANNSATAEPGEVGLVGALVDSDNAFACFITSCPAGNGSNYYAGLNDGMLNISFAGAVNGFKLKGLDYGFVAPSGGLPNFSYGQLVLTGTTLTGSTISVASAFPGQNAAGRFMLDNFMVDAAFGATALTSLTINACLFDGAGDCLSGDRFFTQNQAQFALDNLRLNVVPEPGSVALLLLGVAGLGAASRRRAK